MRTIKPENQVTPREWLAALRVAGFVALSAVTLALVACSGTAELEGTWHGTITDQGQSADMSLELEEEGGELAGEGSIESTPIEVTAAELTGSEVSIDIEDGYDGQSLQGELVGELDGDTITGEGNIFSAGSSGNEEDRSPFELARSQR